MLELTWWYVSQVSGAAAGTASSLFVIGVCAPHTEAIRVMISTGKYAFMMYLLAERPRPVTRYWERPFDSDLGFSSPSDVDSGAVAG